MAVGVVVGVCVAADTPARVESPQAPAAPIVRVPGFPSPQLVLPPDSGGLPEAAARSGGTVSGVTNGVGLGAPSVLSSAGGTNRSALAGGQPAAAFVTQVEPATDPTEVAYGALLALDDAAQEEMDRWIREADAKGDQADNAGLQKKIGVRLEEVDQAYRGFLEKHPEHARARIAFGSFLSDTGRDQPAREQWELALKLDPSNPATYNNLAGSYGHRGPVTNAFAYYEKAIALDPREPVYYQNFATTVFLFRRDVMEYYGFLDEQRVFDKALGLYRKAAELQPGNFILATDLAQTYYGVQPPRHQEALQAWQRALDLARDDLEREGVRVHVARTLVQAARFEEARSELGRITNPHYATVKDRIARTLERKEGAATNLITGKPGGEPIAR